MADLRINEALAPALEKSLQQKPKGEEGFGRILNEALGNISRLDKDANRSIGELLEGKADIHEVMVAMQKADLSMRLLLTVRNKVIEAYKEIMHMQF